jgi:anaerobic magnesium-protoporphyrin IX monomethyl ester cyclase
MAAYLRNNGLDVAIIDASAESISPYETALRVNELNPLLSAIIVYGSQLSASTQNMTIAGNICEFLKEKTLSKVAVGGIYPSTLPKRTLEEVKADFVIEGEGLFALISIISFYNPFRQ